MILEIQKELDPKKKNNVLRDTARPLELFEIEKPETQKLIDNMIETMYHANGIGIAAPQIGISKQVVIIETPNGPIALINPRIMKHSLRRVKSEEGCLSVPGKFGALKRWRTVTVDALDRKGQPVHLAPKDFTNIILQHEIDHLHGTLYVDRVTE